MKAEQQIARLVTARMAELGWPLISIHGLPAAFARDQVVTAYCSLSDVRQLGKNSYLMEGAIGIVHTEFEAHWNQLADRQPKAPVFAMSLHTANLSELDDFRYIRSPSSDGVEGFCTCIASVLELLPTNNSDLLRVYRSGCLLGRPLSEYAGYSQRAKHKLFIAFLESLALENKSVEQ
jgi:hypothetical protein